MRTRAARPRIRILIALAGLVIATTWPSRLAGQSGLSEGYDPMRQITAQLVKANLLIVLDRTGSMQGDRFGYDVGDTDGVTGNTASGIGIGPDVNPDNVTGRMFWQRHFPRGTATNNEGNSGAVPFSMVRTSDGKASNTPNWGNIPGVNQPGIFYVEYSGSTATIRNTASDEFAFSFPWTSPTFPNFNNSNNEVRATRMPLLDAQNRLVYSCKPVGTWQRNTGTPGTRLPWNTSGSNSEYFFYNDAFDLSQCALAFWQLRFDLPSRLANVKNALGNSVYLQESYTPPVPRIPASPMTRWPDRTTWTYSTANFSANPWNWFADVSSTSLFGKRALYQEGATRPLSPYNYNFIVGNLFNLESNSLPYNPTLTGTRNRVADRVTPGPTWVRDPGVPFKPYYVSGDADLYVPTDQVGDDLLPPIPTRPIPASPATGRRANVWSIGMPKPGFGTVGPFRKPQDVIGGNSERINFGLLAYSSGGNPTETRAYFHVPIDTTDGNNVARFQALMAVYRTSGETSNTSFVAPVRAVPVNASSTENVLGLTAGGGTPTRDALMKAQGLLPIVFDGGSVQDLDLRLPPTSTSSYDTFTYTEGDPKKLCNRPYGVVLVTDGHSNTGNPSGTNWLNPCSGDPQMPNYGDTCTGKFDCPNEWNQYAAQPANDIWVNGLTPGGGRPIIRPRTWAIGISPTVGPCELSFIAYMGRTDASSPSGDAGFGGFDADKNPHLPDPTTPVSSTGLGGTYDGPTGQRRWAKDTSKVYRAESDQPAPWWGTDPDNYPPVTGHGYNAFFATDAGAIGEAFTTIVNATAIGDYSTNAPVSGMSAGTPSTIYLPTTGFPTWDGHIYAYDVSKYDPATKTYVRNPAYPDHPQWLVWDAGLELNKAASADRKIFTWDPGDSNKLIEVTTTNLSALKDVATENGLDDANRFTSQVIDFIRGNDGSGNPRAWRLGPMINSAPALVAAPQTWMQNTTSGDHKAFQMANSGRDALLWVGSNHGMMHAFRTVDGVEQIAIVPPNLLARQVELFENFEADDKTPKNPSGQPPSTSEHLYGVANSFRFGDIYDGTSYRTIGVITLGPGGTGLAAIDVTKVPRPTDPSDPTYVYPTNPFSVLWTKTPGTMTNKGELPDLQQTWSIPAMGPASAGKWRLFVGSGFNKANTRVSQTTANSGFVLPRTYVLDPATGDYVDDFQLTSKNNPTPFVGNQAFADAVFFDPLAKSYQEDNIAKIGLQADLNGRIWFTYDGNSGNLKFDQTTVGIDVSMLQSQPIYYNPAVSGYGGTDHCVAYAFGSGTLYERSDSVTGSLIGTQGFFVPRIYVASDKKKLNPTTIKTSVDSANITSRAIGGTWNIKDAVGNVTSRTIGRRAQLTAPPFMLVPKDPTKSVTALFLIYDPDDGCQGRSYVAIVDFAPGSTCAPGSPTYTAFDAGPGAASGFTIAGDKVLVSKSGVGEGKKASIFEPPGIAASVGGTITPKVKWWKELK